MTIGLRIIFSLIHSDHIPHEVSIGITAVEVTIVSGMLKRQDASLVVRYVGNHLASRVEFELSFVLLAGFFNHDDTIISGYRAGGLLG